MDAADVGVGCRLRTENVVGRGNAVVEEFVVDQAEFFGGKDVSAEIEVVALVVDQFEGKHEFISTQAEMIR